MARPVIILASRESGGSYLSALLDAHPEFYGAPQLNVLAFEDLWQLRRYSRVPRDSHLHGLLRFLGDCLTGEQSVQSTYAAMRWIGRRIEDDAQEVYKELLALAAPQRLVDYSPLYAQSRAVMERVLKACPEAAIIHLVRNPIAQGNALSVPVWQTITASFGYWTERGRYHPFYDIYEIGEQYIDWSTTPAVFDPQFAWHRTHRAALDLLKDTPSDRAMRLQIETLFEAPEETLRVILRWLGADASEAQVSEMLASAQTPFNITGSYTAPFGVDYEIFRQPFAARYRGSNGRPNPIKTDAPLPWRGDGERIMPEVAALAGALGYSLA